MMMMMMMMMMITAAASIGSEIYLNHIFMLESLSAASDGYSNFMQKLMGYKTSTIHTKAGGLYLLSSLGMLEAAFALSNRKVLANVLS